MNKLPIYRVLVLGLIVSMCACKAPGREVIEGGGIFESPKKSMELIVSKTKDDLILYKVISATSRETIASDDIGSAFHRWFLYWESEEKLWVMSSDLGILELLVFDPGKSLVKTTRMSRRSTELKSLPAKVSENLSNTMSRRLGVR